MRFMMPCPARIVLAAALLLIPPHSILAQRLHVSALVGAGQATWTGPFVQGSRIGPALGAAAVEWSVTPRLALRGEVGGGLRGADLGRSGILELPTTLSFARVHFAALGRWYLSRPKARWPFFAEIGTALWHRVGCDVNMQGGPGFLGGETVDCDAWEPSGSSDARPLRPNTGGADLVAGVGGYHGHLGITLRYEAGGRAPLESSAGPLHVRALILAAEWVIHGHR